MKKLITIQEKCTYLNRDIHNEIFKNNFFNKKNDYERVFTSLDVIDDCQNAFEEFENIPTKIIPPRTTLYIYGVLQAMFCQQDGLFYLYRTLVNGEVKSAVDFLKQLNLDPQIRLVRNEIAGHPIERKGREYYYIAKGENTKYKFTYAGYNPDFKIVDVDLKEIIKTQTKFTHLILDFISVR